MTSLVTAPALTAVAVRVILASLIADEDEFDRWWPFVGKDLFSIDESYTRIASIVTDYSKKHGHAPSFETIEDSLRTDPRMSTADREIAFDALKEVLASPVEDWPHYRDHLRLYVRKRAHVVALEAAERFVETGDFESAHRAFSEAMTAGLERDEGTVDFFGADSVENRFDRRTDPKHAVKRIALQMGNLDSHMRGGLKPKTLTVFIGAPGGGKMLALDTPIPTPAGWTTMGDLKVGDFVFDERGTPSRVNVVYPVEQRPASCYRVTFDDGASIDACSDHLWLTYNHAELTALSRRTDEFRTTRSATRHSTSGDPRGRYARKLKGVPQGSVRTTEEIARTLRCAGKDARLNHAVPVAGPLELGEAVLPIEPYLLGLWLGDGTTDEGHITTADVAHVVSAVEAAGFRAEARRYGTSKASRVTVYGLRTALREQGLLGYKRIPDSYLRGSFKQRLSLLQGLMDTDGTVAKSSGSAEFVTTSQELAYGVRELIVSLGWKVALRFGRASLYGNDCGPKWTLKWLPTEKVFRLPRKAELQGLAERRTTRFRYIVSCDPIPSVPMRCIAVEGPSHLYLAGRDMVPTHNSTALVHYGKVAVLQGQKVLHLTLELESSEIVDKYDSAFTGVSHNRLEAEAGRVRNAFLTQFSRYGDALRIVERPEYSLAPEELSGWLKSLRREGKFFPDVLIIDYADLMTGGSKFKSASDKRFELNYIYTWLHRIAKEENLIVVTATQANRGGMTKPILTLEDIAEDISKAWVATNVFGICQTMKERMDGKCRLFIAKNRGGKAYVEVTFQQDLDKCTFAVPSTLSASRTIAPEELSSTALGE